MSENTNIRKFNVTIPTWNSKVHEVDANSRDGARKAIWDRVKGEAPKSIKYHDVRAAVHPNVPSVTSATDELYGALSQAFKIFNAKLFGGELPDVVFTVDRSARNALGFFWHKVWTDTKSGNKVDEICINASYMRERSLTEILSTLLHEMCHLWQYAYGKPSRNGYHNKEWGAKMKEVGLYPSDTGAQGGKETGQAMTHYIVEDGPFAKLAAPMLANGFVLKFVGGNMALAKRRPGEDEKDDTEGSDGSEPTKKRDPKKKVKYVCGGCNSKAWGKPELELICGACFKQGAKENNDELIKASVMQPSE